MQGNESKWRKISQELGFWDTSKARSIQERQAEIIIQWLKELNLPAYDILEVGCGNGYLATLIVRQFKRKKIPFSYQLTDLLPECLEKSKLTLGELAQLPEVTFSQLDVYKVDKALEKASQEIILSTGFAAAATYKQAIPKVSFILRPGGILICDFINNFSPPVFFRNPVSSMKRLWNLKQDIENPGSKRYSFGILGIAQYFQKFDLTLKKKTAVGLFRNPILTMFEKDKDK